MIGSIYLRSISRVYLSVGNVSDIPWFLELDGLLQQRSQTLSPVPATTVLYRMVTVVELDDLRQSGAFQNPLGIENKYFALTPEGAAAYAQQAHKAFGDGPFTMVTTTLPTHTITSDMRVTVDRGIATVIVSTQQLVELSPPQILSYTPLPGR